MTRSQRHKVGIDGVASNGEANSEGANSPISQPIPGNVSAPSFTGTMTDGQTLTYVPGVWTNNPTLTRQWFADGVAISGATGTTLNTTGKSLAQKIISVAEITTISGVITSVSSLGKYLYAQDAARVFVSRMSADPSNLYKKAYDNMWVRSGFAALLAKYDGFYVRRGPTRADSLLNLAANDAGTQIGTLGWSADTGFTSNGNNNYIDSGKSQSTLAKHLQNDAHYFASVPATLAPNSFTFGLATAANDFFFPLDSGSFGARINDGVTLAGTGGVGLYVVNRTGPTTRTVYKDTVQGATDAQASIARAASNVCLFRANSLYAQGTNTTVDFDGFGASLTTGDIALLQAVCTQFKTDINATKFLVVFAGQSLNSLLSLDGVTSQAAGTNGSGDGSAGSNAIARVFKPTLQAFLDAQYTTKANVLTVVNTASPGSSLLRATGLTTDHNWWNEAAPGPDPLATAFTSAVNSVGGGAAYDQVICIWSQGEAEATPGTTQAAYVAGFCGAGYTTGLAAYLRTTLGASAKIIISPLGRNEAVVDANLKAVRDAETEITTNVANTLLGPETSDLVRRQVGDWHPVSFGIDAGGFDRLAKYHARMAASAFGCTAVIYKGPQVASAAIVNATTTDITLSYPAGCGGTDFTPATLIDGFQVFDAGVAVAIATAVRVDATHVRLTHATVAGARTVRYLPNRAALNRSQMVNDNFSSPMPLRMSGLVTAA